MALPIRTTAQEAEQPLLWSTGTGNDDPRMTPAPWVVGNVGNAGQPVGDVTVTPETQHWQPVENVENVENGAIPISMTDSDPSDFSRMGAGSHISKGSGAGNIDT